MNYYNQNFPGTPLYVGNNTTPNQTGANNYMDSLPMEQSYIENILRLNRGKKVRIHMTFPDSNEYRDREHIILSDPQTGIWHLLLMIYVELISFDEKINYSQEFIPNN